MSNNENLYFFFRNIIDPINDDSYYDALIKFYFARLVDISLV